MLNHTGEGVAEYLAKSTYLSIAKVMVGSYDPHVPNSARLTLHPAEGPCFDALDDCDISFARQMADSWRAAPDAYAVTANSAVPIADSIRGFYDTLGKKTPLIVPITADRINAMAYLDRHCGRVVDPSKDEIKRLRPLLENVRSLDIIDQYVNTGITIRYAGILAARLGIAKIGAIRGRWYHDARPHSIDVQKLTSDHASFMYRIGVNAAKLALPTIAIK